MNFEQLIGIIAMLGYLIYSFNKAKKQKEEMRKRKQQQPVPQQPAHEEPTLEDIFKKILEEAKPKETKKKPVKQKPIDTYASQRELKEKLKKKFKKEKEIETTEVPTYETSETLQGEEILSSLESQSPFTELKSTIVHKTTFPAQEDDTETVAFEFNPRDAVIYSAILNRPYR